VYSLALAGVFVVDSQVAQAQCAPVIDRVHNSIFGAFGPGSLAQGGTGSIMTIYGQNLNAPGTTVFINDVLQTNIIDITATRIIFSIGVCSGDGFVYVGNGCGRAQFPFKCSPILPAPVIYDFTPKVIPANAKTRVYVFGGAFRSEVVATINGQSVPIVDRIQTNDFTVDPPVPRDTIVLEITNCINGKITITNTSPQASGGSATSVDALQCVQPTQGAPAITGFSPPEGGPGALITIGGANLQNISSVRIGRSPAQVVSQGNGNGSSIIVNIGNSRTGYIEITTPGGTAVSRDVFTFIPRPVITSVAPNIIGPGTPVYIRGTNLLRASVNFGGVIPINVINASDTLLVATIGTSGTITSVYPALILSAFVSNIPVNLSAPGGSTVAPETIVFVKQDYARPRIALRLGNAAGGARINEADKMLLLNERRATFYPPEAQQKGAVLVERRNWNVSVDAIVKISYFDSGGAPMILRGYPVIDTRRSNDDPDVRMPVPPVAVSQLPFFPPREIAPINGLWGDLLPVRGGATLDTLRFGESVIPIKSVPTLFEANRADTTPINVRARWSDQLYPNNPEGFLASALSVQVGRQGKRRMVVQLMPSPVSQYDIDTENSMVSVVLDDPPSAAPDVINPVAEHQMFAGRTDSVFIEAEALAGNTSVRPAANGGVLPKDIFYDDNYLPLTYTVRSSDPTRLTVSLGTGSAALGSRPFVRFTLLPTAISGSTVAVIITANNGLGGIATHQFVVRVQQGAPVIASVNPEAGRTGTSITITGRDFGATPRVSFVNAAGGTIDATPSASSDTQITVQVPNGAETGRISVTNSIGTGQSQNDFVIVRTPQITGFSPDSAAQGTTITIRGSNFRGANRVTFGGVAAASVQVVSDTEIKAVIANSGASGTILVANPLDSGRAAQQFVFFPPPSIQSFTPTTSGAGSTLTLTGLNFSGTGFSAPDTVRVGGRIASFAVLSPTQMTVTVPDFEMMTVPDLALTIRTRGGTTTATTRFTFIPCPSINMFTPASGNPQTTMTISGTGLQAVTGVSIGGVPVRLWSIQSPTSIVVTVGSVESGEVQITAGACTITAPGRFTYQAPARALLIQPSRFTKIFPGDTQQGTITLINQGAATLSVGLALLTQTEENFRLGTPNTFTLRRNESTQATVTFAPRTSGAKSATVSASIQGATGTIDTLLTASAGVWQVAAVNFDTVRTGRSTLRSALIINRNTQPTSIDAVRLPSDGAFVLAGTMPRWVGKGDTVAAIIRCQPSVTQQRLQSVISVESVLDTGFATVTAFSRTPLTSDIVLETRFVAERDTLVPGQNVALRLELTGGQNLDRLRTSAAQWRASVRWNQNVLLSALNSGAPSPASQGQFTLVSNSETRNPFQRVNFTSQSLALSSAVPPTLVLGSIPVGVYYGSTNTTPLELENFSVTLGGQTVFSEEAQAGSAFGRFTALTGGRFIQRVGAAALTVISPNPAQNMVSVKFALPVETAVVLSLVDARGNLLKTLAEGWFVSGEHNVEFDASAIPSGSYIILLHTERDRLSRPIQFIR
jgi:hypothetical protein